MKRFKAIKKIGGHHKATSLVIVTNRRAGFFIA